MKFPNDNNVDVVGRHNRPSTLTKTFLEMYFMDNGNYVDPYAISAVFVFPVPTGGSVDNYLDLSAGSDTYGQVTLQKEWDYADYKWTGSGSVYTSSVNFAASAYDGTPGLGRYIWKISTGRYGVVLDPSASCYLSGVLSPNYASAVGEYFDVWQVKMTEASRWVTLINRFELFNNVFVTVTEPLDIQWKARLVNNKISEGSVVDITIPVDLTVRGCQTNKDIANLFSHSIIDNASIEIMKHSEHGPWTEVSGFSDTSGLVRVDSNDTIRLLVDSSTFKTITGLGSSQGIYKIRAKFSILNETFITPQFTLQVGR